MRSMAGRVPVAISTYGEDRHTHRYRRDRHLRGLNIHADRIHDGRLYIETYTMGHAQLPSPHSPDQSKPITIDDHSIDLPNARTPSKIRDGARWSFQYVRPTRQSRLRF